MTAITHLKDLTPDPRNARKHNPRNVGMIETALQEVGAARSIVVDENGMVLAGNATIEAAAAAGIERVQVVDADGETIIAVRRTGLTDEQKRKLAFYDNRTAELADWDLDQILADVNAGLDLSALWREDELDALLAEAAKDAAREAKEDPGGQVDKADELRVKWGVVAGQTWALGNHRITCGDCTDKAVVEALGPIDAVFTDPPYGINVDTGWLSALNVKRGKPANMSDARLANDDGSLDLSFLFEHKRRFVWGFPYIYDPNATGWIVWDKQPGVAERGIVTPVEMASTTMRKGFDMVRVMWGGYYRAKGETREPHPTQKPLGVFEPFIADWTVEGETVLDPFLGSGTTLIACERLGRKCRAVELSPSYLAVTLDRWATMTGKEPRLLT